jgi:hypothetical protein
MSAHCWEYVRLYHDMCVIAEQYKDVSLTSALKKLTGSCIDLEAI